MPHACIILYSMFALRRHRCTYRMRTTVFCFSKMLFRCPKSRFAKHRFGRFSKYMGHKKKYKALILKYVPCIFGLFKSLNCNNLQKPQNFPFPAGLKPSAPDTCKRRGSQSPATCRTGTESFQKLAPVDIFIAFCLHKFFKWFCAVHDLQHILR